MATLSATFASISLKSEVTLFSSVETISVPVSGLGAYTSECVLEQLRMPKLVCMFFKEKADWPLLLLAPSSPMLH